MAPKPFMVPATFLAPTAFIMCRDGGVQNFSGPHEVALQGVPWKMERNSQHLFDPVFGVEKRAQRLAQGYIYSPAAAAKQFFSR